MDTKNGEDDCFAAERGQFLDSATARILHRNNRLFAYGSSRLNDTDQEIYI